MLMKFNKAETKHEKTEKERELRVAMKREREGEQTLEKRGKKREMDGKRGSQG